MRKWAIKLKSALLADFDDLRIYRVNLFASKYRSVVMLAQRFDPFTICNFDDFVVQQASETASVEQTKMTHFIDFVFR